MKNTFIASLVLAAAIPGYAAAADGTINFTGAVQATTCQLASGANSAMAVVMPTVNTAALAKAGDTAGATNFNVVLSNCGANTGAVRLQFTDTTNVDINTGRLNNTASASSATNVQIALRDGPNASTNLRLGTASAQTTPVGINNGGATIPMSSIYVATGAATAGAVQSSVQFSIAYQ